MSDQTVFGQNGVLKGRSLWPKDSLVTLILFELWIIWYSAQSQIHRIIITLYLQYTCISIKSKVHIKYTYCGSFPSGPSLISYTRWMWCYSYHLICFKKSSVTAKWKPLMLVARLVELWKKTFFFLGLPKNYTYCENSAGFSKAAPETHKYRLSFMTHQKDCIWLLNKFRKNSYLEKCVQNSNLIVWFSQLCVAKEIKRPILSAVFLDWTRYFYRKNYSHLFNKRGD